MFGIYQVFLLFKKGVLEKIIETHEYTAKVIAAKNEDYLIPIDVKKCVSGFVCCLHLKLKFNQIMPHQQISINPCCGYVPFWWCRIIMSSTVAPTNYIHVSHIEELRIELWNGKNLKIKHINMPSHFIVIRRKEHNIFLKIQVPNRIYKGLHAVLKIYINSLLEQN